MSAADVRFYKCIINHVNFSRILKSIAFENWLKMASNNYSNELRAIEKLKKKRDFVGMCEKLIYVIGDLKSDAVNSNPKLYEKLDSHVEFCLASILDAEIRRCLYSYMATLHRIYKNKEKCLDHWRHYWLNTAITRELDISKYSVICLMISHLTCT